MLQAHMPGAYVCPICTRLGGTKSYLCALASGSVLGIINLNWKEMRKNEDSSRIYLYRGGVHCARRIRPPFGIAGTSHLGSVDLLLAKRTGGAMDMFEDRPPGKHTCLDFPIGDQRIPPHTSDNILYIMHVVFDRLWVQDGNISEVEGVDPLVPNRKI